MRVNPTARDDGTSWLMTPRRTFLGFLISLLFSGCRKNDSVNQKVLTIGAILPLTGDNAKYGIWIQEALELYKIKVNSEGGINGARLEIIYEDDQTKPEVATSAMRKLIDVNKVPVVYGSWASSCVLAQAPIAEKARVIVVGQAISPKIRDAGDYIFRSIPDANHSLEALVPFARKNGTQKAAVIYVNNDYGVDQAAVFKNKLTAAGGEVVFEEGYNVDQQNFLPILAKLQNVPFDTLYLPGYSEVGTILKQAKELGITATCYASDPFENEDILEVAKNTAEGVCYPFFYLPGRGSEKLKWFEEAYKKRYARPPEGSAALAYNGIDVVVSAMRQADDNWDTTKIKAELYKIQDYDGVLGRVSVDQNGDMLLQVYIKTVRNGKFIHAE
ncbi:MAG: ABC transporter substrate-binding protein [Planctomycetota bacterium]